MRVPRLRAPGLLVAGALGLAVVVACTAAGPSLAGFDPAHVATADRLLPPGTAGHHLGTDGLGRDVMARTLAGFRWSLAVALLALVIGGAVGTVVGVAAGWHEGWPRAVLSRAIETAIAFPALVLALAVIAAAGHGFWALVLVLGLVNWVGFARVVLAETRSIKRREYVLAARLLGLGDARVILGPVLRALRPTLLVVSAFAFADLLVAEASLSFLGIGAPLGTPSWGGMLADSRQYVFTAPWLLYAPAAAVVLAVLTANLLGDGLTQLWGGGGRAE
ncbi:MAG TPA: ABC transporter permease [Candidatus Dormibacteraeota bacterium]